MRERVCRIIQGKKLVGYHLPQKMADFGLFEDGSGPLTDTTNVQQENEETLDTEQMPNALPTKQPSPVKSKKQSAFGKLQLQEAYDMAKLFNGPGQTEQRSIVSLCEDFLNLNMKKRPTPAFAFTETKIAMALFKQYLKLSSQLSEDPSAEAADEPKKEPVSRLAAFEDQENQDPKQVLMPKYPALPSKASPATKDEDCKDADDVLTVTGVQLKALISQYCSEVVKDELRRALSAI